MDSPFLIYGSYGYTGDLIAQLAVSHGHRPTLGGRNEARVRAQAEGLGLPYRVFGLENAGEAGRGLEGMTAVIHCAGPFAHTARAMAEGCIAAGCHYLDITGEIKVFETMHHMAEKARQGGIMLLPGAGFDVVPSDCLAAHLKRRLPSASELILAFYSHGRPSHGTATTIVENIAEGGCIRTEGKLQRVPGCWQEREVDFGEGVVKQTMSIPWGDVSTAYYSTGIPNVQVYMAAPEGTRRMAKLGRYLGPILGSGPVQRYLKGKIPAGGPSDAERARGYCLLWGVASDEDGNVAEARLRTPEGYTLTAMTALGICERVLAGEAPVGFQTPSLAYGADFVLGFEGVRRS